MWDSVVAYMCHNMYHTICNKHAIGSMLSSTHIVCVRMDWKIRSKNGRKT